MTPSALTLLPPARPLKEPTWYAAPSWAYTLGPEVGEICALAGYAPEPEQQLLLDGTFAVAENGKSAAFEIDVIAARRALKTGYVVQCILGWLFVTHEPKIMYTAHDLQAAQETWETVASLIESTPALAAQLKQTRGDRPGIIEGNGRWAIVLAAVNEPGDPERGIPPRNIPKRTVIFKTRGKSTGRALSGNKLVVDEAFAATQRQVGSVLPILGAEPDPQVVFASSAGMADSTVLIDARDRGRAGGTARQLYAEWGDRRAGEGCKLGDKCDHAKTAVGCVLDDEERWAEIIPTLGGRVQLDTIRSLRQTMPPEEFAREFMVWWDVVDQREILFGSSWKARKTRATPPSPSAIGIARGIDLAWTSIGAASTGEIPHLGAVKRARGTDWVVAEAKRLQLKYDVPIVIDGKGPAKSLIQDLEDEGLRVVVAGTDDYLDACSDLWDRIESGCVTHGDYDDLNDAVRVAAKRFVGDRFAWARKAGDISMLEAVTLAMWGGSGQGESVYESRGLVVL